MEGIVQAQEARILQLEAQNRSDADNRERERQTLISDFRVASASSRTQDLSSAASASSSTLMEQDNKGGTEDRKAKQILGIQI